MEQWSNKFLYASWNDHLIKNEITLGTETINLNYDININGYWKQSMIRTLGLYYKRGVRYIKVWLGNHIPLCKGVGYSSLNSSWICLVLHPYIDTPYVNYSNDILMLNIHGKSFYH